MAVVFRDVAKSWLWRFKMYQLFVCLVSRCGDAVAVVFSACAAPAGPGSGPVPSPCGQVPLSQWLAVPGRKVGTYALMIMHYFCSIYGNVADFFGSFIRFFLTTKQFLIIFFIN